MSSPPKVGGMKLHDAVVPDLAAGLYRITSDVAVSEGSTSLAAPPSQETFLDVFAPRFVLDPDEIADCYPPPGGLGAFQERLPHIALGRRALPWSRRIDDTDQLGDTPWMALLLLKESEATITQGPLSAVLPPGVVTELNNVDPISGDPTVTGLTVNSIDTFRTILPTRAEMSLLTHVRQVNLADTAFAGDDDDGWFSVVVSNRLPLVEQTADEQNYLACLVSLEARDDVFDTQSLQAAPALVLLYAWQFTSSGQGGTFEALAESLDVAPFGTPPGGDEVLDDAGRLPVRNTDHDGETTPAHYRGPLLGLTSDAPVSSADDISLAAASTLGRLLGAADGRFLREMVDWHRRAEAEIRAELEADEIAGRVTLTAEPALTVAKLQQHLVESMDVSGLAIAKMGQITLVEADQ